MGDIGIEKPIGSAEDVKVSSDELQCTICMSSRFIQECRVNGCNHSFCFSCISEWVCQSLRPSCPMCRQDVDKISYDFTKHDNGRIEIGIRECRSGHTSLTPGDRINLLSERRFVVRNIMNGYKRLGETTSAIMEQKTENDLKSRLVQLTTTITQHLEKAEITLANLRSETTRKNKALVFKTPTFRRMIYSTHIKMRYCDSKKMRPKESPMETFREVMNEFLITELDAIPFSYQPNVSGVKWRTKFFGQNLDDSQKKTLASQLFSSFSAHRRGAMTLQNEMCRLLPNVCPTYVTTVCDHLEGMIHTEKTTLAEFYNEVYYDSSFNNFPSNYMDLSGMLTLRDEQPGRFEAIYQQIQRQLLPQEWEERSIYGTRFGRQTSNTDRTDRATNNDEEDEESISERSASPDNRMPTPTLDDIQYEMSVPVLRDYYERALNRPYELITRYQQSQATSPVEARVEGVTSRTLPRLRTLRPSDRRYRDIAEHTRFVREARPETRRDERDDGVSARVRELANRTELLTNLFRPRNAVGEPSDGQRRIAMPETSGTSESSSTSYSLPRYFREYEGSRNAPAFFYSQPFGQSSSSQPSTSSTSTSSTRPSTRPPFSVFMDTLRGRPVPPSPPPPRRDEDVSIEDIIRQINQEDADNGLDFISVAHRTRSARRAASNGQYPVGPPVKRPANNPE